MSMRDIFQSFVRSHKALRGLGAWQKLFLFSANPYKPVFKSFFSKNIFLKKSNVDVQHRRTVHIWGDFPNYWSNKRIFKVQHKIWKYFSPVAQHQTFNKHTTLSKLRMPSNKCFLLKISDSKNLGKWVPLTLHRDTSCKGRIKNVCDSSMVRVGVIEDYRNQPVKCSVLFLLADKAYLKYNAVCLQ